MEATAVAAATSTTGVAAATTGSVNAGSVAEAHGGSASVENTPDGARVTLDVRT